jgi:hypothetical protein
MWGKALWKEGDGLQNVSQAIDAEVGERLGISAFDSKNEIFFEKVFEVALLAFPWLSVCSRGSKRRNNPFCVGWFGRRQLPAAVLAGFRCAG